jgi:hypothetical protein
VSVENAQVVDAVGVENSTGRVVLTISDHLDWQAEGEHVLALQEKIDAYLEFIQSGQLLESYPEAQGRQFVISIMAKHPLSSAGQLFLEAATNVVREAGFELRFRLFEGEALEPYFCEE